MKKHISMPSIKKFSDAHFNIAQKCRYDGIDEFGEAKFNNSKILPILDVEGSVKLHGTNASICYNKNEFWVQSKKQIITIEKDNVGFAFFVESSKNIFLELFKNISEEYSINNNQNTITIYGEWAGKKIQGKVAISKIDRKFFIFGIKITPYDDSKVAYWVESSILDLKKYNSIYHIKQFKVFNLKIDFNNPKPSSKIMKKMVDEVEKECPVAKYFDVLGIGEGIVFETFYLDSIFRWKLKGTEHTKRNKSNKRKINKEEEKIIDIIVEKITPEWRLSQMIEETFDIMNGGKIDIKKMGNFIKAVNQDIIKEDLDVINEANLMPKDINKRVAKVARKYLIQRLEIIDGF